VAIKRKGYVARPGVHYNVLTGKDEVITWEALKEAVQFQNRIPLVLKHPMTGYINPSDRIGTVTQRANEKEKVIEGEFWFFDEPKYWSQIPPDLKKKIIGGKAINLSAGYKVGPLVDGRQTSRQYDHIALDVTSPMQNVGITEGDVRMESKLPEDFRIEETPTIEGEKKEEHIKPPKAEPYDPVQLGIVIGELKGEIASLKKQLEVKPAVEETTEETRPEQVLAPEPEPPKPKTVVPLGVAPKEDAPDDDGLFRIVAGKRKTE
jgi:hypothetical protein